MFRIRAKAVSMCRKIAAMSRSDPGIEDTGYSVQAALARAIHLRAGEGLKTNLRQLHKITDLPQSDALRAVRKLERLELITIEQNIHDEWQSTITLSDAMRERLDRTEKRDTA